jgi:hypothetical protein
MKAQNEDKGLRYGKEHATPTLNGNEELADTRDQGQVAPSISPRREPPANTTQEVMPPGNNTGKLYSTALKSKIQQQQFKITVKSKGKQSAETIKEILKAKINHTDIKVGINSLKMLRRQSINNNKQKGRSRSTRDGHKRKMQRNSNQYYIDGGIPD